ncbi:MAG: hypothetical protein ACOCWA_07935 [Bacteroidota bacterium]
MIRIALFGQPALAHNYIEIINNSRNFLLSGIKAENGSCDYPTENHGFPVTIFENEDDLLTTSDAIIFLNFRNSQYLLLKRALKESKHVLVNPSTFIPHEILCEIQKLGEEAGTLYYLRHKSLNDTLLNHLESLYTENAEFIDIYRYIPAGSERNQTLVKKIINREVRFMYSLVHYEIKKINIKTVPYYSINPYIINIRFEFSNSSTVNMTINFFTEGNARYTELYFGKKMLRISSDENKIEFANRDSGKFQISQKNLKLMDEGKLSEEIILFLNLLSGKHYPPEFKDTGITAHQTISYILNEIFQARKTEV